jgi:hypothetical protein
MRPAYLSLNFWMAASWAFFSLGLPQYVYFSLTSSAGLLEALSSLLALLLAASLPPDD